MDKAGKLRKIADEIQVCKICPLGKTGKPVPGEGNSNADIVFIGEAPGRTEAATGRPFVGRSGKLLRLLINTVGIKEEDVFITSPVKYLPIRGTPTTKDIDHGRIHLDKQLAIIDPKIIVLLGNVAAYGVLKEKVTSKKDHGKIIKKNGKTYMLTVHPAAGLRFPPLKKLLIEDFQKLQTLL